MILNDIFENKFNYLNFENITSRVFKDYGKLFFDKGLLPDTNDNYKIEQFTDSGREFLFIAHPVNIEKNVKNVNKVGNGGFIKNLIKEERNKNNEFVFYDDDFPPLK
jgi:hypothetical protein